MTDKPIRRTETAESVPLLPCPFCGGEAEVRHMDLDSIEEGWKVWGVWCVDDMNAEDYRSHGHFIDNYATEAEAIAAWNTRAERTCENVHGHCSKCGSIMYDAPNYCPCCGRCVKEVDE